MISREIVTYIRTQLARGTSKETIARNLTQNGWLPSDVADGFAAVSAETNSRATNANIVKNYSNNTGAKIALSALFVLVSAGYAFFQYVAQPQQPAIVATAPATVQTIPASQPSTTPASTSLPVTTPVATQTAPPPAKTVTPVPVQTTPVPVVTTTPAGQYADGSYTGSPADAYYGTVQIQAVIKGGKLTAVNFLSYPNDRSTSRSINARAMPQLKTEAIQAQSANVDGVSGATDTSQAFIQSLGSALAEAKN